MSDRREDEVEGQLRSLRGRLASVRSAVVLTGAGISVESGLGTFRGPGGLWENVSLEETATPGAFAARPGFVWRWYADRWRAMRTAAPNPGHRALADWQRLFESFLLVTQNIDGLHQQAGSTDVLELHGGLGRARCAVCQTRRLMDEALALAIAPDDAPRCGCGGRLRPDIVWFGERLPEGVFERAQEAADGCDLFVSVGTSATVYPAAGLIEIAHQAGALVIEVNPDSTSFSHRSHGLAGAAGALLPRLTAEFKKGRSR